MYNNFEHNFVKISLFLLFFISKSAPWGHLWEVISDLDNGLAWNMHQAII